MENILQTTHWFRSFFQLSREMLMLVDKEGAILERNPAAAHYFPPESTATLPQILDDPDPVLDALKQSHTQKQFTQVRSQPFHTAEGQRFSGTCKIIPVENGKSRSPTGLMVILTREESGLDEIGKAAQLQDARVEQLGTMLNETSQELLVRTQQLAEQRNKIQAIINSMGDGLASCDRDGYLTQLNETARTLLQLKEDALGQHFADLCPTVALAIGFDPENPTFKSKEEFNVTYTRKDLRLSVSPIFNHEKNNVGSVMIIQDRTKQAEIERMKSELISIVSHELRSPLTSIKGYVDLMVAGDLGEIPASMKSYLEVVAENANRLARLIDDMLDLSRIESGKLAMHFGKVDIQYLCDYVYLTTKPQAVVKNQDFRLSIQKNSAVSGDIERLQQALTNLVSNAIKYTPEGGRIDLTANKKTGRVLIQVKDNGVGIDEADQARLFQKFFRVKNEKTRNIGGTGLGLCITKSIVEAHNGTIQVESKEGQGSTFTIELPEYLP